MSDMVSEIRARQQIRRKAVAAWGNDYIGGADSDTTLIQFLQQRRKYYDEEIFRPWTIEEGCEVHAAFPNAVDRIAADSARRIIDTVISDIEAGKHRKGGPLDVADKS